ncbi:MAG TPA: hypothetical protein VM845_04165 [Burkholderiaceae bacterium]|nr:hypothetical protein [Burkholderiaceae bacterium]
MSMQRSVGQQNAETLAEIRRTASDFASSGAGTQWLHGLLQSHGLSSREGVLVKLAVLPEQGGNLYKGVWLSVAEQFWEFTVQVPYGSQSFAQAESFENITHSVAVSAHMPGTGKSFGHLAQQVLREANDG